MATSKTRTATAKKPATTRKASTAASTMQKKVTTKVTAKTISAKKPVAPTAKPGSKPANKAVAPRKAAAQKAAPRNAPAKSSPPVTPEQRYRMIQDAAYFLAEKNGFKGGAMGYWIAAEIEIDEFLAGK